MSILLTLPLSRARAENDRYDLHTQHLNEQMVRVLQTIGYDVGFTSGRGQYLFDRKGARYLDLLAGWGVFALGRNHPGVRTALTGIINSDLPNLVQMDVSVLSGVLAEKLLAYTPYLDKAFFANSGAEAVEAAVKFARSATGRSGPRLLRSCLSRPDLWRAVDEWRCHVPQGLWSADPRYRRSAVQ